MDAQTNNMKKQIVIFAGIAFVLPYLLGILMAYGYSKGIDLTAFPSAQMYYPAAGAILAVLITRKGDSLIPRRFFIGFLILTLIMFLCSIVSIITPDIPWNTYSQYLIIIGSVAALILLLTEKKDKRAAYGLRGGRWKAVALIVLIYVLLYFVRTVVGYLISGETQTMLKIARNPLTWIMLASLIINYFLVFTAFFGEEYGWRYYLQPVLQKKLGMVRGIFVLGIIWGLWHLPINFFYYTSPSMGFISLTGQLITCITLGVFYGWAYLKTDNIWTVVILHFVNNNLVPVITGNYSADVLQNQSMTWNDVLFLLIVNTLLFMGVIFTKYYKDNAKKLPTMDERAELYRQKITEATEGAVPAEDM